MRKFLKYLLWSFGGILVLPPVVVALLYLPAVQDFVKDKAVAYVAEQTGMVVKAGHFRLGFPLTVTLADVYVGKSETDTLAAVGVLHVEVGIGELLNRQVSVDSLVLQQVKFNMADSVTGMDLRVDVGELGMVARQIDLVHRWVEVASLRLAEGTVDFVGGRTVEEDTVTSGALDWLFTVKRMDLRQIDYRMRTAGLPSLRAGLAEGSLSGGEVALGMQEVTVDTLRVAGVRCDMLTAAGQEAATEEEEAVADTAGMPWTVRANAVVLENSAFTMGSAGEEQLGLVLSGIGVRVDSLYNRGAVVRAQLKEVRAVQPGGVALTAMQGQVVLDSAETALRGGYLRTRNSRLKLEVLAEAPVAGIPGRKPLAVLLSGELGLADAEPFYPHIPQKIKGKKLNINTSLALTDRRVQVGQLLLELPGHLKVTGSGSVTDFREVDRMRGSFMLRGELPDVAFAQAFLERAGVQGVAVPAGMDLLVKVGMERGKCDGLVRLCCGRGCLTVDGSYGLREEAYDGALTLNRFPLGRFLPADSLGVVSADLRLTGRGFDLPAARSDVALYVREFDYRRHRYRDVSLAVALERTRLRGTLMSRDDAASLGLVFKGDSLGEAYAVSLGGRIGAVDVQRLHFVPEPLALATRIGLRATVGREEAYTLQLKLDSVRIADAAKQYNLGSMELALESGRERTAFEVESGDLHLDFRADTSVAGFVGNIGTVAAVVQAQLEERHVDMEEVRKVLPPFGLTIRGAEKNAVARFLRLQGVGFKDLAVDIVARKRTGVRLGVVMRKPGVGTVRLDSVQFGAWQTGRSLMYALQTSSASDTWKGLFNINMMGRMQGERFRVELTQKDAEGKVGVEVGVNTVLGDSLVVVSLFPVNPVLGYNRWEVNGDNRVEITRERKVRANLRMACRDKLVSIQSLPDEGERTDRIRARMVGVELAELSKTTPFMPQLDGELNMDLLLYALRHRLGVDGHVGVRELGYGGQRVASLELGVDYLVDSTFREHMVEAALDIDSLHRLSVKGRMDTSEEHPAMALDVEMPSLPLYVANAFLPADLMQVGGTLRGGIRLRGTPKRPQLDGELAFRGGVAEVGMIGTAFRLDTLPLRLQDGRLRFDKYRFYAPDNSALVLDGEVVLAPFDRMGMDLSLRAKNFEAVNVKKNPTSLLYGKAYADVNARLSGALDNLNMTGKVSLLNTTNVSYTLRSSDPTLVDKSVDVVRFVTFRDSTDDDGEEFAGKVNTGSFSMKMQIEIGEQVKAGVDLSEDGANHVNIRGGGNLALAVAPESGMTLSGKYILTGGTVEYNVPIVGKKEFSIRSGSSVEWSGDVMAPSLDISAAEQLKAEVEDGDRSREVVFESIIRIRNTLARPDITFDLAAPNDMVIQNQLATFSPEERTRQALNLLIYNTYTAPGAASSDGNGNLANNAIYSFVENELNKYTRKAGLTVGFDSHGTEENMMRTDVTYQFSRELFNDRVRVKIGGRISTDGTEGEGGGLQDNLVDDISIEYVLTKRRNLYAKVFRHSNYESVLDGEVVQTGAGIVWRKNFRKFKDMFKNKNREERRRERELKRHAGLGRGEVFGVTIKEKE